MEVRMKEPMAKHTTFRAGGEADWYVLPENVGELSAVLSLCRRLAEPWYVIGNGSNLLVSDEGYRGVMIGTDRFDAVEADGHILRAGAGVLLSRLANEARRVSLSGFEFAAGIPGTLGGAVVMNAGAYGGEMRDVLVSATVLTPEGEVRRLLAEDLELGYRASCIQKNGYLVLEAEIRLEPGDETEIRRLMDDLAARRKEKQPLEFPSAGSTFKRPEGHYAGQLIEKAGLKGYAHGGAQVSEKHAGFVINRGGATAEEIYRLCRHVQEKVWETSGVAIEMEVRLLGRFPE